MDRWMDRQIDISYIYIYIKQHYGIISKIEIKLYRLSYYFNVS